MMKAMLGGTIIASDPDAAIRAALKSFAYPLAAMAVMRIVPRAAVSAGPEPDIPAKIKPTTIVTRASPP